MPRNKASFKQRHVAGPPKDQAWVWHAIEMRASPVWTTLPLNTRRLLDRIELEHMRHCGQENGRLEVSYDQFVDEAGIGRRLIAQAIVDAEDRGLLQLDRRGWKLKRVPNQYRLTYFATRTKNALGAYEWSPPTDEWRRAARKFENRVHEGELSQFTKVNFHPGQKGYVPVEGPDNVHFMKVHEGELPYIARVIGPVTKRSSGPSPAQTPSKPPTDRLARSSEAGEGDGGGGEGVISRRRAMRG